MNIKLIEQVAAEHNIDADSLRKTIENDIAKVDRKNNLESLTEEAERLTKTYKNQYMCLGDELEYIRIKKIYNHRGEIYVFGDGITAYDTDSMLMFIYAKGMHRRIGEDTLVITKTYISKIEDTIVSKLVPETEVKKFIKKCLDANNEYLNNRLFNDSFESEFEE